MHLHFVFSKAFVVAGCVTDFCNELLCLLTVQVKLKLRTENCRAFW